MDSMRVVRERAMREAMPFPLVTVVVDAASIEAWLPNADESSRHAYEQMIAAGMVVVKR